MQLSIAILLQFLGMPEKKVASVNNIEQVETKYCSLTCVREKEPFDLDFIYVRVFLQLPSTCTYVPVPINTRPVLKFINHRKHCSCLTNGMTGQACRGMSDLGRDTQSSGTTPSPWCEPVSPWLQGYNQQNDAESPRELVILQQRHIVISNG